MPAPPAQCLSDADLLCAVNGEEVSSDASSHLQSCPRCAKRLERLRSDLAAYQEIAGSSSSPSKIPVKLDLKPEPVPDFIGPYKVLGSLSQGGQARVFRVLHPTFQKEMVLKLGRHPLPAGEGDSDRLVAEGRLLSDLNHPNLVHVYDLNFFEERPYLVLEYIRGRTLAQVTNQRPIHWREAARLIAKVARALAPAHAVGIYHRDITPRNVIIDEHGEPRLIDFGLSRFQNAWNQQREPMNVAAGTHGFMAPEQALGENDKIDGRTDVYALGAVLQYLLLSRRSSRQSETNLLKRHDDGGPEIELLQQIGVRRSIQRIINRAMAANPVERFATVIDMANALERAARQHPWPIWSLAAVAATTFTAALVLFLRPTTPPPPTWTPPAFQEVLHDAQHNAPLLDHLPLEPQSQFFLRAQTPKSWNAILLIRGSDGRVRQITEFTRADPDGSPADTFRYAKASTPAQLLQDEHPLPDGMLVVVMLAQKEEFSAAQIENLKTALAAAPLPALKKHMFSLLGTDAYPGENSLRGSDEPENGENQAADELDKMLKTIAPPHGYMTGVAVPYSAEEK